MINFQFYKIVRLPLKNICNFGLSKSRPNNTKIVLLALQPNLKYILFIYFLPVFFFGSLWAQERDSITPLDRELKTPQRIPYNDSIEVDFTENDLVELDTVKLDTVKQKKESFLFFFKKKVNTKHW